MISFDGYYRYIYKTINIVNNHFYIGQHTTKIIEDRYMGSGHRLYREFNKYGFNNFKKEIIEDQVTTKDGSTVVK